MPVYRAYVFRCGRPRCTAKPHVIYEELLRTDLRTAERMARENGWVRVGDEWYCSAKHAAEPYLERKRARSATRAPRGRETAETSGETLVAVAGDTASGPEETLVAVAADGRTV